VRRIAHPPPTTAPPTRSASAYHSERAAGLEAVCWDLNRRCASATSAAAAAVGRLGELVLTPAEVEEAALKCCWLARYWGLARRFGIYPEISATQAEYWRTIAPPPAALLAAARALRARSGPADAAEALARFAPGGSGAGAGSARAPPARADSTPQLPPEALLAPGRGVAASLWPDMGTVPSSGHSTARSQAAGQSGSAAPSGLGGQRPPLPPPPSPRPPLPPSPRLSPRPGLGSASATPRRMVRGSGGGAQPADWAAGRSEHSSQAGGSAWQTPSHGALMNLIASGGGGGGGGADGGSTPGLTPRSAGAAPPPPPPALLPPPPPPSSTDGWLPPIPPSDEEGSGGGDVFSGDGEADELAPLLLSLDGLLRGATSADLLEIERGLRQLRELGVEAAVFAAIAERGRLRRLRAPLPASLAGEAPAFAAGAGGELSPEEVEDAQFRCAWLAYMWRRAASAGIDPQLAPQRAEYWRWRMDRPVALRDGSVLGQGLLELSALGLELQFWRCRPATGGGGGSGGSGAAV